MVVFGFVARNPMRHDSDIDQLAAAYLVRARARRRVLQVLMEERAHSDVVREAQELVELALRLS